MSFCDTFKINIRIIWGFVLFKTSFRLTKIYMAEKDCRHTRMDEILLHEISFIMTILDKVAFLAAEIITSKDNMKILKFTKH